MMTRAPSPSSRNMPLGRYGARRPPARHRLSIHRSSRHVIFRQRRRSFRQRRAVRRRVAACLRVALQRRVAREMMVRRYKVV